MSAKRKRWSYEEQERQPLRGRVTKDFESSKFKVINKGKITLLENLILKGIVILPISAWIANYNTNCTKDISDHAFYMHAMQVC